MTADTLDAKLAVRSPYDKNSFVFVPIPEKLHAKDILLGSSTAVAALEVIRGNMPFIEYPLDELGKFGIQVLAASTCKTTFGVEHRSRLVGLYGASQLISFIEPYLIENREIKKTFLAEECKNSFKLCGPWSLHYTAERLMDARYNHNKKRAAAIGAYVKEIMEGCLAVAKRQAEEHQLMLKVKQQEEEVRAKQAAEQAALQTSTIATTTTITATPDNTVETTSSSAAAAATPITPVLPPLPQAQAPQISQSAVPPQTLVQSTTPPSTPVQSTMPPPPPPSQETAVVQTSPTVAETKTAVTETGSTIKVNFLAEDATAAQTQQPSTPAQSLVMPDIATPATPTTTVADQVPIVPLKASQTEPAKVTVIKPDVQQPLQQSATL